MTEKQIVAREKELQSYFRMHPRLNLEFKAQMSRLLREHRIDVTPETLSRMTIALDYSGADPDDGAKVPHIPPPPKPRDPQPAMEPSGMGEPRPIIGPPETEDDDDDDGGRGLLEPDAFDEPR